MKRLLLAAVLAVAPAAASAQFATIGPTPATSDNGDRLATTAWVNNFIGLGLPLASGKIYIGSAGNIATAQTMSADATLAIGGALTLATVNANVGSFGSATNCVSFTTNAKGLITAASATACTPGIASVTGLGTGVATALGINVGTAGAFVVNGGAGGTPSSITLTNGTGLPATGLTGTLQAAQEPAHTGDCENAAASLTITCKRANSAARGGAFDVWQRLVGSGGTTVAVAASTTAYTNDGWYILTGANEAATITQATGIATGSVFAAKVQRNSGQTGTTVMRYAMPLDTDELVPLQGQFVTLSFTMKEGANQSFSHAVTATLYCGTGAVAKRGSSAYTGETSVISSGVTTTTAATRFQATSAAVVPANCTQMEIQFSWTPSGTAGVDDSFTVDDLQLEPVLASTSTASSFIKRSTRLQLADAQRLLWVPTAGNVSGGVYGIGMIYSAVLGVTILPLPVPMRSVPALGTGTSVGSAFQFVANGATFTASGSPALQSTSTTNAIEIDFTIAGATGGNAAWLRNSGATAQLIISAEI